MAVQVELSYLETFPSHLSPLDVLMLKPHLDRVFLNDTDPPTILFTPQSFGRTGILLRVHHTTEEETAAGGGTFPTANTESARRVRLFTSRFFLRHHGLQQFRSTGTVRAMGPVSLDRVVLGARSRQSLRLAGSEQFTSRLLELCRPGHWLLARQGDPLLLPRHTILGEDPGQHQLLELLVLECSPVRQGRITADTSLVLTDCWDSVTPPPCRPLRLCVSDFAHYADGLCAGRCLLGNRSVLDSGFPGVPRALLCRVEVLVMDIQRWLDLKEQHGVAVDVDSCVFVTKQLLLRLGLFNREWVRMSMPGRSEGPTEEGDVTGGICRERLVSVVVMDLPQSPELQSHDNLGLISPALWFNMTEGEVIPVNSFMLKMKVLQHTLQTLQ